MKNGSRQTPAHQISVDQPQIPKSLPSPASPKFAFQPKIKGIFVPTWMEHTKKTKLNFPFLKSFDRLFLKVLILVWSILTLIGI
jgi:hypothetical protein